MWLNNINDLQPKPDELMTHWLSKVYYLTDTLQATMGAFTIDVLSEGLYTASAEEKEYLKDMGKQHSKVYVRQVAITGPIRDMDLICIARVVIPYNLFTRYQRILTNLNDRPIGEAFLYDKNAKARSPFSYQAVLVGSTLVPESHQAAIFNNKPNTWARRSLFAIDNDHLSIVEIFSSRLPIITTKS